MTAAQSGRPAISAQPIGSTTWQAGQRDDTLCLMNEAAYVRIQTRIKADLGRQSPSTWIGAAFTFLGVALSGLVALIVFPQNPGSLPAGAKSNVVILTVAATMLFVVCLLGYRSGRSKIGEVAEDVCKEMDLHAGRL